MVRQGQVRVSETHAGTSRSNRGVPPPTRREHSGSYMVVAAAAAVVPVGRAAAADLALLTAWVPPMRTYWTRQQHPPAGAASLKRSSEWMTTPGL